MATDELERPRPKGWVLVGYDGTAGSRAAVRWAANEAAFRGAQLRVVVAWFPLPGQRSGSRREGGPDAALRLAEEGATIARHLLQDSRRVRAHVQIGAAADVLVDLSRQSTDLLVLGCTPDVMRGPGRVARRCLAATTVPVVTLSAEVPPPVERRIVTASQDGASGGPAMGWALERAAQSGHPLYVLGTWQTALPDGCSTSPRVNASAAAQALELHQKAMFEVGTVISGRALLTGRLVQGRVVEVEAAYSVPGDLLVADIDEEHLSGMRPLSPCPMVWVPMEAYRSTAITSAR